MDYYQKVQLIWIYFVVMLRNEEEDKEKKLAYYKNLRKKRYIKGRNNGLKKGCRIVSKIGKKIGKSKIKCRYVEIDEKQLLFNKEYQENEKIKEKRKWNEKKDQ